MGAGLFQPMHLVVILIIVLIVFGAGKLPEVGKAVGDGIREFKRATNDAESDAGGAGGAAVRAAPTVPSGATVPDGTPAAARVAAPGGTCSRCGAAVQATNRFCPACGAVLAPLEAAAPGAPGQPPRA